MTPCLNWKELELFVSQVSPEIEGLFVDRIVVPERERFPEGYLKGEWAIRLTGRKNEGTLLLSIRARHPYLAWKRGKGPKAAVRGTRSPFDLNLSKQLKGAKLLRFQSLPRERVAILWFSEEGSSQSQLGLVLVLIPTAPEAFLVTAPTRAESASSGWKILSRSRTIREESKILTHYLPPDGAHAPPAPPIRSEFLESPEALYPVIEKELFTEAFSVRLQLAEKSIRHLIKHTQERMRQSRTAYQEALREENWQKLGDLLKGSLGTPSELQESFRNVLNYDTGETVQIKCDPKLTLIEQIEKFYQNSRRKQKRLQEAQARIERFQEVISRFEQALEEKPSSLNWKELERLERLTGAQGPSAVTGEGKPGKKGAASAWLGKSFVSREGLSILVGRNKDENLELTFKHARGNDLWMHVRGRPGAHTVIPLQPGKSAPLETLLDAATLTIYYSGGENWGKTEVDYTFKKYVKRIKDSTEASYTHNKTLLIEPDKARLKKLLEQGTSEGSR